MVLPEKWMVASAVLVVEVPPARPILLSMTDEDLPAWEAKASWRDGRT